MKLPWGMQAEGDGLTIHLRVRWLVRPFAVSIWGFGVAGAWSPGVVAVLRAETPWRSWGWSR